MEIEYGEKELEREGSMAISANDRSRNERKIGS